MNDFNPFLDDKTNNDNFIEESTKTENKATRTLRKGIECVHCEHIFDCAGHLGDLCVNFQQRRE